MIKSVALLMGLIPGALCEFPMVFGKLGLTDWLEKFPVELASSITEAVM